MCSGKQINTELTKFTKSVARLTGQGSKTRASKGGDPLDPNVKLDITGNEIKTPSPAFDNTQLAAAAAAAEERQRNLNRKGRGSTILTGGQGVTAASNVFKKTLLGT